MSTVLETVVFDHAVFETELESLGLLLTSKVELSETQDTSPTKSTQGGTHPPPE